MVYVDDREQERRRLIEAEIDKLERELIDPNKDVLQMEWTKNEFTGSYRVILHLAISSIVLIQNSPHYSDQHTVNLNIPTSYPHSSELIVEVVSPTFFHPNVPAQGRWSEHLTLQALVFKLWDLFSFQAYNPSRIRNFDAYNWVERHKPHRPLSTRRLRLITDGSESSTPRGSFRAKRSRSPNMQGAVEYSQDNHLSEHVNAVIHSDERTGASTPEGLPALSPPQLEASPATVSSSASSFRRKELRVYQPEQRGLPLQSWEQGQRHHYSSWRYTVPPGYRRGRLKVIFLQQALDKIFRHALEDRQNERFGILIGGVFSDPQSGDTWVEVVNMLPAERVRANSASVEVSNDEISRLNNEVDQILSSTQETVRKLGWYHTHPGHNIFMSETDRTNQSLCYTADWQVALVVDPVNRLYGAFCGSECAAVDDGLLVLSEGQAETLSMPAFSRWRTRGLSALEEPAALVGVVTGSPPYEHEEEEDYKRNRDSQPLLLAASSHPAPPSSPTRKAAVLRDRATNVQPTWKRKVFQLLESIPPPLFPFMILICMVVIFFLAFSLIHSNADLMQSHVQLSQIQQSLNNQEKQSQDSGKSLSQTQQKLQAQIKQNQDDEGLIQKTQQDLLASATDATTDLKDNNPLAYRRILRTVFALDRTSKSGIAAKRLLNEQLSYTVVQGDTLSQIAKNFNVSLDAIIKLNQLQNPDNLQPGQPLKIPGEQVTNT